MMPTAPFGKIERLTKTREYQRVYKEGMLTRGEFLSAYILLTGSHKTRLGISIGTRAARKATSRNRLKRIIREYLRQNIKNLKPGSEIVIAAKKGAALDKLKPAEIRQELLGLIKGKRQPPYE
jgi:ribonuclease P protein component